MSPLQQQFPLSPRKFWKKFISKVFSWVVILLFLVGFYALLLLIDSVGSTSSMPSWAGSLVGLSVLGLTFFIVGGMFAYAWYLHVYIRRYYYAAGDNFVTIKKGVFAPAEIHVMYQKIQDVYVDQDILDRFMGLYDVHLASATVASGMEAHIDGVDYAAAEGLKNMLLAKIQGGGTALATGSVQTQQTTSATVQLSEDVSSRTYPLSGAWFAQSLVAYLFSALFISGFVTLYLALPGRGLSVSPLDYVGAWWVGVWFWMFVVIYAFHVIYLLIWKSVYHFEFLPEYIQMRTGIISRSEMHIPYRAVQDVRVSQGIIERLFGLATVNIENAAQAQVVGRRVVKNGVQIPGQPLVRANHIADVVRGVTLTKNTAQTGL